MVSYDVSSSSSGRITRWTATGVARRWVSPFCSAHHFLFVFCQALAARRKRPDAEWACFARNSALPSLFSFFMSVNGYRERDREDKYVCEWLFQKSNKRGGHNAKDTLVSVAKRLCARRNCSIPNVKFFVVSEIYVNIENFT